MYETKWNNKNNAIIDLKFVLYNIWFRTLIDIDFDISS